MYDISGRMTNDEDFSISFTLINDEDEEPIDLTNAEISFSLSQDGAVAWDMPAGDAGITIDIPTATVSIYRAADDGVTALEPGIYRAGCKLYDTVLETTQQLFVGDITIEDGGFGDQ